MNFRKILIVFVAMTVMTLCIVIRYSVSDKEAMAVWDKNAPTDGSVSSTQSEDPDAPIKIIRQPENRTYVPGTRITLSLKAMGNELQYQWYYKKPGQKEYRMWMGHTHSSELVDPNDSWDGIKLYCVITDSDSHSVQSDTITVYKGETLTVLGIGDSICSGRRNGSKGFVGDLGLPYINAGVSGSSLSTVRTDVTTIPDQLMQITDFDPDIIIAEGGLNDLYRNAPMGDIPTVQADSIDSLDTSTITGGMQKLFLIMKKKFPDAQHCFLIVHKIFRKGVYLVNTPNKAGYTQTDMHDAFVACCNVYGIEVIDIFQESPLDTSDLSLLCECNYTRDSDPDWECARSNETDYINGDGVHPLNRAYLEFYVPVIRKHIHTEMKRLKIVKQPRGASLAAGDLLTLSVSAQGVGLRYQWYYKKKGQKAFHIWKGHVSDSESVVPNASWDGIQLYCKVSDKFGHSVRSDKITVRISGIQ